VDGGAGEDEERQTGVGGRTFMRYCVPRRTEVVCLPAASGGACGGRTARRARNDASRHRTARILRDQASEIVIAACPRRAWRTLRRLGSPRLRSCVAEAVGRHTLYASASSLDMQRMPSWRQRNRGRLSDLAGRCWRCTAPVARTGKQRLALVAPHVNAFWRACSAAVSLDSVPGSSRRSISFLCRHGEGAGGRRWLGETSGHMATLRATSHNMPCRLLRRLKRRYSALFIRRRIVAAQHNRAWRRRAAS